MPVKNNPSVMQLPALLVSGLMASTYAMNKRTKSHTYVFNEGLLVKPMSIRGYCSIITKQTAIQ